MDIQLLLEIQIVADIVLCAAVVVLLRRTAGGARERAAVDQDLKRLTDMLEESRQAASRFMEGVEESRKSLKELSFQLDDKERRLKDLLCTRAVSPASHENPPGVDHESNAAANRYGDVLAMYKRGMSGSDIARQSGIPEGEVSLIIDLERVKDDGLVKNH